MLGVYNVLDFVARLRLRGLQAAAHRLHGRRLLALCALRLALPPLVYICVRPRLVRGGWGNGVILAAVAALALSNGLLATLSMMSLSRLPARLREDAVYVAVAALYLGLATGATVSWGVGAAMGITQMDCGAD